MTRRNKRNKRLNKRKLRLETLESRLALDGDPSDVDPNPPSPEPPPDGWGEGGDSGDQIQPGERAAFGSGTARIYAAAVTHEHKEDIRWNTKFRMRLTRAPADEVKITMTSSNLAEGKPDQAVLTFTTMNWQTWQDVTVYGQEDDGTDDGSIGYSINFAMNSINDPSFNLKPVPAFNLWNLDNDCKAFDDPGLTQDEDTVATYNVRGNDKDLGGNGTYHVDSASVVYGNISVEASGNNVIVSPTVENWYGDFKFKYTLINEYGKTSIAWATGKLLPVNDAPNIAPDSATVNEGGYVSIDVRANDSDVDHPAYTNTWLTPEIINFPGHGIAWVSGNTIDYTPDANYNGPDSMEYIIKDEHGWFSWTTATVDITVKPKNVKPKANGAGVQTDEDTPVAISFSGEDEDPMDWENQAFTYIIVTPPTNGSLDLATLIYTPDPDWNGTDFLEYVAVDDDSAGPTGGLVSDPAIVTIGVYPVNDVPTADPNSGSCDEDTSASLTLTGDDGDPMDWENQTLTYAIAWGPSNGSVSLDPVTGAAVYTPDANYNGEDSFAFTVTDDGTPALTSAAATVVLSVAPVNDAPTAVDDGIAWITPDMSVTIPVLDNDFDIDGPEEVLTVISVDYTGSHGTVTFTSTSVTFTGNGDWTQGGWTDTFTYTIQDQNGATSSAMGGASYSGGMALMAGLSRPRGSGTSNGSIGAEDEGFQAVIEAARDRWEATGVDTSMLDSVEFRVVDLEGSQLALAVANFIVIDRDAAGIGWFVDATPGDDQEFHQNGQAKPHSEAAGRVDLLTAVMHEMGHLMGAGHSHDGLMDDELDAGVRRNPDRNDLALMLAIEQVETKRNRFGIDHFFAEIGAL